MKVLITGSASGVAKGVIRRLDEVYDLRLLDLHRSDDFLDHDWVIGSILDRKALDTALKQAEAVINFVIVRGDASELSFDVNVKGLYMLLEAIEYHGIKRFVQVSSTATVIGHWYEGKRIPSTVLLQHGDVTLYARCYRSRSVNTWRETPRCVSLHCDPGCRAMGLPR